MPAPASPACIARNLGGHWERAQCQAVASFRKAYGDQEPDLRATVGELARRDFGDAGFDVALEAEEIEFHLRRTLP